MGVYSQFDRYVAEATDNETYADESYFGIVGAYQAMEESSINAHSIFEAIIGRDFAEAAYNQDNSVISESDMAALNEAVGGGIWTKIKEFVQKVWNKLLGILKSVKDRVIAVFTRDGKELVNKFSKQIKTKLRTGKLSKFKWKFYDNASLEPDKISKDNAIEEANKFFEKSKVYKEYFKNFKNAENEKKAYKPKEKSTDKQVQNSNSNETSAGNRTKHAPYTSEEKTDLLEQALGIIISQDSCSKSDFNKEFEEFSLGDLEEKENIDGNVINSLEETLKNAKKAVKAVTDAESNVNKTFKNMKKDAENIEKEMSKVSVDYHHANLSSRYASRATTCVSILDTVSSMYFSNLISAMKKILAQTRKIYISAATYNQKGDAYEEATLMEAVGDVSDYEVEEMFAAY